MKGFVVEFLGIDSAVTVNLCGTGYPTLCLEMELIKMHLSF